MRESGIERAFVREVEKRGGECWKLTVPGRAGVPDRLVLFPGGSASFVELKAPGEKPRKLQNKRIRDLRELGFTALVVDSLEGAATAAFQLQIESRNMRRVLGERT